MNPKFDKGDIIGFEGNEEFQYYIVEGLNKDNNYLIREFDTICWVADREDIDNNYIKIGEITKKDLLRDGGDGSS